MTNLNNKNFNFHNSYLTLPSKFYSLVDLSPVKAPKITLINESLCNELGLDTEFLCSNEGIDILAGNQKVNGGAYIAQAYAGHQFGHFTMLGDGRAVLIGEHITPSNKKYDIVLKGAGKTLYSRGGDGRATLGPMLREYIISEAMHNLHIPTTRSLAVVSTGEVVYRENELIGSILTRVASSHVRFGTFQYAAQFGTKEDIKELADYCIERHYPAVIKEDNRYVSFLKEVVTVHSYLVAKWQSIGFIHGVMNTDNMTISGETIDYGPCAFMNVYDPNTVFSSIDVNGRYSYGNQPKITLWNLCRFAEALLPIIDDDKDIAVKLAQEIINEFDSKYEQFYLTNMLSKLGILNEEINDKLLIDDLLSIMFKNQLDFTNSFISLTFKSTIDSLSDNEEFIQWRHKWQERLSRQNESQEIVTEWMKNNNPSVIPRNHKVEEAILEANNGDLSYTIRLLDALSKPYDHSHNNDEYKLPPISSDDNYKTYCGT